jgi:hypothetical protein
MTSGSECTREPTGVDSRHGDLRRDTAHERLAHRRRCTNVLSPARFVAELAEERVPEAARECSHEGS